MTCPLCNSTRVKQVLTQSEWAIKACQICTNAWTVPAPTIIEYDQADFHGTTVDSDDQVCLKTVTDLPDEWRKSVLMQSQLLARHLKPKASVLEIGCSEGILLSEISKLGFDVKGIEPSMAGSKRASRKGLDVVTGYFPNLAITGQFDAVILSHVLEHVSQPFEMLSEVIDKISPKGYLLLVQANYQGAIPKLYKEKWYAWSVHEHYWHFTPEGLKGITRQLKLHTVECEFSSLVHWGRVVKLLQTAAGFIPKIHDQFHLLLQKK